MEHKLTIRFEVHEGDVTPQFLWPIPRTGITDVVNTKFVENQWEVTSAEPDAPTAWIGRAESKHMAILEYLKTRLGIYSED